MIGNGIAEAATESSAVPADDWSFNADPLAPDQVPVNVSSLLTSDGELNEAIYGPSDPVSLGGTYQQRMDAYEEFLGSARPAILDGTAQLSTDLWLAGGGRRGSGSVSRRGYVEGLPPGPGLRAQLYDRATDQIRLLDPQASYTLQSPTFVPTQQQVRSRFEQLDSIRLRTVNEITEHSFVSHVLGSRDRPSRGASSAREFPEIRTVNQFKSHIDSVLRNPTYAAPIPGRSASAFWHNPSGTVVIVNHGPGPSTAFQPKQGINYYWNLMKR